MHGHAKPTLFCSLGWPNTISIAEWNVLVRVGHAYTSATRSEMCGRQQILVGFPPKIDLAIIVRCYKYEVKFLTTIDIFDF